MAACIVTDVFCKMAIFLDGVSNHNFFLAGTRVTSIFGSKDVDGVSYLQIPAMVSASIEMFNCWRPIHPSHGKFNNRLHHTNSTLCFFLGSFSTAMVCFYTGTGWVWEQALICKRHRRHTPTPCPPNLGKFLRIKLSKSQICKSEYTWRHNPSKAKKTKNLVSPNPCVSLWELRVTIFFGGGTPSSFIIRCTYELAWSELWRKHFVGSCQPPFNRVLSLGTPRRWQRMTGWTLNCNSSWLY